MVNALPPSFRMDAGHPRTHPQLPLRACGGALSLFDGEYTRTDDTPTA